MLLGANVKMSEIVTIDHPNAQILAKETESFGLDEWPLAHEISQKLWGALKPYFPAAGLAAPQIGISKAIFIYSYDRDPAHLETVINPSFIPLDESKVEGWEACLSTICTDGSRKIAKIPRYEKIQVTYFTLEGQKVDQILEAFAARVFQHEYDHLKGIVNIYRNDALVKTFASKEEMSEFMQAVKKGDASHYKKPQACC